MPDDILNLAAPGVRGLSPYVPGKPLEELARDYGIRDAVKLASNENPLGPSPLALQAMRAAMSDLNRYPDGAGVRLKRALADKLKLSAQQITLGNGSNDILELIARAFVSPEEEVIFSAHAFAVYPIVTQAVGAHAVITPAREWGHNLDAMLAAVNARTKLIFIANPNNPTGTWLARSELEKFLRQVPAHVLVVLDEAYFEYVQVRDYPDGTAWLPEFPNLIVTRTFSKAYGLAGLRVGYGLGSEAVSDLLNRVRQPFNVNSLAQEAAIAALADTQHLARARATNAAGMAQLQAGLNALDLTYIPSVGNFICVELPMEGQVLYERLLHRGVIVRPVANYGMPQHIRVTIGLPEENQRFLDALRTEL